MATDYEALGSAIHSRIGALAGSQVYRDLAVEKTPPPYIVWGRVSSGDEYAFGTVTFLSAEYYVKAVTNRTWDGDTYGAYGSAHALMQDAPLSVSGYRVLEVRRMNTFDYMDRDNYWHVGGNYKISLSKP
jgi:hypothetical protein